MRPWPLGPLKVRATGAKRRLETWAWTLELAAGPHREHRRRALVEDRDFTVTVVATAVSPAGMRAEDETGEEDDGNDEDDARHNPDPGGDRGEPTVAPRRGVGGRRCGGWLGGGGHGTGRRF